MGSCSRGKVCISRQRRWESLKNGMKTIIATFSTVCEIPKGFLYAVAENEIVYVQEYGKMTSFKKIVLPLLKGMLMSVGIILLLASILVLVVYIDYKKDYKKDMAQQEKILGILNGAPSVRKVVSFVRSSETRYTYNVRLLFDDNTKLAAGDIYLRGNELYYNRLFHLGKFTEPQMLALYEEMEKIEHERGIFTDVSDPDVIEIYLNRNFSRLLEDKDKMLDFLRSFPFVDGETYKKSWYDSSDEIVRKFNLVNCYERRDNGVVFLKENVTWVVFDGEYIYRDFWLGRDE